jgi:hypothetical protein
MTKQPTKAVRNAIAFVAETGNFPSSVQVDTRLQAQSFGVEFQWDDAERLKNWVHRPYFVTDEGRAIADASPLGLCIAWAKARGFRVLLDGFGGRKAKPNFIRIANRETGVEGFISGGERVFLPEDGSRWKSELAFDACKRRARAA